MKTKKTAGFLLVSMFCSAMIINGCDAEEKTETTTPANETKVLAAAVSLDADKTAEPISKYIYGQFIEHLGNCIYQGIWAEMLEDRKFFYPVTDEFKPWSIKKFDDWVGKGQFPILTGSPWKTIGPKGSVKMIEENPFVGEQSPRIQLPGDDTIAGIEQPGLGLIKGKKYKGRIILAGAPEAAPIHVSLIWGQDMDQRQTVIIKKIKNEYETSRLKFKAGANTNNARLQIVGLGKGKFKIGTVSLMPADNIQGFRKDVVQLMKELDSPVYRWPGGNFVSGYNWRDGVGPRDKRPPRKNPAWTGIEHNDVGIHEFMTLCKLLDTEPFIAVNTGLGDIRSVAEEVRYCNGSADTPMGKWRAENGHKKPFNVKWWAIGNEMYGRWQLGYMPLEEYVKKHNEVARAMYKADPAAQLIAVGSVGKWSETMLTECSDNMNLISEHFYCTEKKDLKKHIRQIPNNIKRIANAHRNYKKTIDGLADKDIRIALDEWNYWLPEYLYGEIGSRYYFKEALGIAAGLHEYFRNSDIIFMANYAQTVNVIGAIKTSKTAVSFAATGLPLKLYRNRFGTIPIVIGAQPEPLDVTAAWTEDRKAITIAVVNITKQKYELALDIVNARLTGKAKRWLIRHDDLMAYNEPGKEPQIVIEEKRISRMSDILNVQPQSITLYRLDVR